MRHASKLNNKRNMRTGGRIHHSDACTGFELATQDASVHECSEDHQVQHGSLMVDLHVNNLPCLFTTNNS
jgi:hypothetical protein